MYIKVILHRFQMEHVNKDHFVSSLKTAVNLIDDAVKLGTELVQKGYDKLVFVGCGAPYRVMSSIIYWVEKKCIKTRIFSYYPAEFINQDPQFVDDRTVVIFGSYSGKTKEIVDAANWGS